MASMRDKLLKKTADIGKNLETTTQSQTSQSLPKTAPGQMLAFRTEILEREEKIADQEKEIAQLKEKLRDVPNGTFLRTEDIPLSEIDNSPFQPRKIINPEKLDELGMSLSSAGLNEPIKVRIVKQGRYELISGHRRVAAAKNIGWKTITATIVNMTDDEASLSVFLQNESREDLSDIERAYIYKQALDTKIGLSLSEIANFFGTSKTYVSNCLSMLSLPDDFLDVIKRKPSAIGINCANKIRKLLNEIPDKQDIILEGVKRIVLGDAPQSGLQNWVKQMIRISDTKQAKQSGEMPKTQLVTNSRNEIAYKIKLMDQHHRIQIDIEDKDISIEKINEIIVDALKKIR